MTTDTIHNGQTLPAPNADRLMLHELFNGVTGEMQPFVIPPDMPDNEYLAMRRHRVLRVAVSTTDDPNEPTALGEPFESSVFTKRDIRRGVHVPLWAIAVTANTTQAIVLAQIAYWFQPKGDGLSGTKMKTRIFEDNRHWIYKWYSTLARETKLTRKQVGDAVRKLMESGILRAKAHHKYGRVFCLDAIAIRQAMSDRDIE